MIVVGSKFLIALVVQHGPRSEQQVRSVVRRRTSTGVGVDILRGAGISTGRSDLVVVDRVVAAAAG